MGRTYTAAGGTITLTDADLDLLVSDPSTHGPLTGLGPLTDRGPLTDSSPFGFAEPNRPCGPHTVTRATDGPGGRLPAALRELLVMDGLLDPAGRRTESVLLDRALDETATAYVLSGRPDPLDHRSPAPSLAPLVRFAQVTDDLAGLRGRLAAYAERYGTRAVAEVSRQLLAALEEGVDGEPTAFRGPAALIRPSALAAGPGTVSGLSLDLPFRLLDDAFGRGAVVRFEEVDFPATLTHGPSRRFLCGTGLPENGFLFSLDTDLPLRTFAEHCADDDRHGLPAGLPAGRADRLIRLGDLADDHSLLLDGTTGAVFSWNEPHAVLHFLTTDLSTLAVTLWLLHRERSLDAEPGSALTSEAWEQSVVTAIQVLSALDPVGTAADADWHRWTELLQDEVGGVL